jgi:invasion protein IalB
MQSRSDFSGLARLTRKTSRWLVAAALGVTACAPASALTVDSPQTGAPAGQQPAQRPKVTVNERFSSWALTCATAQGKSGTAEERCLVSQLVSAGPGADKVVLGVSVDYLDNRDAPTMRFRFSSNVARPAGIGIKIDDQSEMRLPFSSCNMQRCEAAGRMTPQIMKLWADGKRAQVAFLTSDNKPVALPVSLNGLQPALAALRKKVSAK